MSSFTKLALSMHKHWSGASRTAAEEALMTLPTRQAVMDLVLRSPGCDLEDIIHECPGLTWNQIFLEIDQLSREGEVVLKRHQPGHYSVTPCIRHS